MYNTNLKPSLSDEYKKKIKSRMSSLNNSMTSMTSFAVIEEEGENQNNQNQIFKKIPIANVNKVGKHSRHQSVTTYSTYTNTTELSISQRERGNMGKTGNIGRLNTTVTSFTNNEPSIQKINTKRNSNLNTSYATDNTNNTINNENKQVYKSSHRQSNVNVNAKNTVNTTYTKPFKNEEITKNDTTPATVANNIKKKKRALSMSLNNEDLVKYITINNKNDNTFIDINLKNEKSKPMFNNYQPRNTMIINTNFMQSDKKLPNVYLKDKTINTHYGPVEPDCIIEFSPEEIIENIVKILPILKISFVMLSYYKISCSKNGINTIIEVMNFEENLNYIKFKMTQGLNRNYRELCSKIINEFYKIKTNKNDRKDKTDRKDDNI